MTKTEFVKAVAAESGLTGTDAAKAVAAMQNVISTSMSKGESIVLLGFGTFSVKERSARTGRNPRTGATIRIAAKRYVHFKPGKGLIPDETAVKKPAAAAAKKTKSAPGKTKKIRGGGTLF